jgi:hypothetical protein
MMINRRSFLLALTVQPVLYYGASKVAVTFTDQLSSSELDSTDFIVVGGWTLLKTDVLEAES